MKKSIILFGVFASIFLASYATSSACHSSRLRFPFQVHISTVINPEKLPNEPVGRSFAPIANAIVDPDCNLIEVDFNYELGPVTILVINQMGQVVTRYACDTNMEATVCLQSPAVEGAYTIRIIGTDYEGEGYFEI